MHQQKNDNSFRIKKQTLLKVCDIYFDLKKQIAFKNGRENKFVENVGLCSFY